MFSASCARPAVAVAVLLAVLACAHGQAHAWTQTRVTGVAARLDATRPPRLRVALDVHVQVSGGWLSRLELATLDPDLVLASDEPALLQAADGTRYTPTSSVETPGTVVLAFDNRHLAPWRGEYVATLTYDTTRALAEAAEPAAGQRRVRWRLPGWEVGLSDVQVSVRAPLGSHAAVSSNAQAYGDQVSSLERDGASELHFARVTLPRTEVWELAFDVPARALAPQPRSPHAASAASSAARTQLGATLLGLLGGLSLAALALVKRRLVQRACRRHQLQAHALLALRTPALRQAAVVATCLLAGAAWNVAPLAAGALAALGLACALDRRLTRADWPAETLRHGASSADLASSRRGAWREQLEADAWLDATRLPGLALLAGVHALALRCPVELRETWLCAAWLVTPLWLCATRWHRPAAVSSRLAELAGLRAALPAPSQLVLITSTDGAWLDARIELTPEHGVPGAARLELVSADADLYGRPQRALAWLVACDAHSPAEQLLARALPDATPLRNHAGNRVARLCVTHDPARDAEQLLRWLAPAARPSTRHDRAA